jgi:hypothetical protein
VRDSTRAAFVSTRIIQFSTSRASASSICSTSRKTVPWRAANSTPMLLEMPARTIVSTRRDLSCCSRSVPAGRLQAHEAIEVDPYIDDRKPWVRNASASFSSFRRHVWRNRARCSHQ